MRKIIVNIATSADGFISRSDGGIDWLERPGLKGDYGMAAFVKSVDTILYGRKTYDLAVNERGVWAQPDTDRVFADTLKGYLPAGAVRELPCHINDDAFADACAAEMIAMLRTRFEPDGQ